jgi:hypothetical protein
MEREGARGDVLRKVAGSSPDVIEGFSIYLILPRSTMTLTLTQALTEVSTRRYFWEQSAASA